MKVAVVNSCIPFVAGESENLAEALRQQLNEYGHPAIIVSIPSRWHRPSAIVENILACRCLRLPQIDLMIGLNIPACYLPHPNKVLWLVDLRHIQDLPATEEAAKVRETVIAADNRYLREARKIYAISETVSRRVRSFNAIASEVLYPPLLPNRLHWDHVIRKLIL